MPKTFAGEVLGTMTTWSFFLIMPISEESTLAFTTYEPVLTISTAGNDEEDAPDEPVPVAPDPAPLPDPEPEPVPPAEPWPPAEAPPDEAPPEVDPALELDAPPAELHDPPATCWP